MIKVQVGHATVILEPTVLVNFPSGATSGHRWDLAELGRAVEQVTAAVEADTEAK